MRRLSGILCPQFGVFYNKLKISFGGMNKTKLFTVICDSYKRTNSAHCIATAFYPIRIGNSDLNNARKRQREGENERLQ